MSNFLVPGTNSHRTLYGDESTPVDPNRSIARTSNWGAMKTRGGLGLGLWRRKHRVGVFPGGDGRLVWVFRGCCSHCVRGLAVCCPCCKGSEARMIVAGQSHTCGPNCDVTQAHVDQAGELNAVSLGSRPLLVLNRTPNPLHETRLEHRLNHFPPRS